MFTVLWMTLLFFLWGSTTYTVESALGRPYCSNGYCITLNEGEITAEAGLCVVIPCSFTTADGFTPKSIVWFKCDSWKLRCGDSDKVFHINRNKVPPEFLGRVLQLDPDVSQGNCSIMINDLTTSDSGSYQLKVNGLYYGTSDGFTFSSRTFLSVKDLNQKPSLTIPPLTEGQQATLTCTAPGLCSGSPPIITWMWRGKEEIEANITGNTTTSFKTENLTAVTQRHSSILTFNSSAKHHDTNITCKVSFMSGITTEETVTLKVNYVRKPQISGRTTVMEGEDLNLSCSVDSVPPSVIKWTKPGTETKWQDNVLNKAESRKVYLQEKSGHVSFSFMKVTTEEAGRYICTATYQNESMTEEIQVKVTWPPKVLNGSGCVLWPDGLTCVCLSEGFPLPTIQWPLLKDQTEYSITSIVSNHTVNSTVTINVRNHGNISFECISSNENGEAKENLTVLWAKEEVSKQTTNSEKRSMLVIIIASLVGFLLAPIIYCFLMKFYRIRRKNSEDVGESLEMITPLMSNGQAVQGRERKEALAGAPEANNGPKELVYASIDFSLLNQIPTKRIKSSENKNTEYAEIKINKKKGHQVEKMTEEDSEMENCVQEVKEEVEEPVYAKVKES